MHGSVSVKVTCLAVLRHIRIGGIGAALRQRVVPDYKSANARQQHTAGDGNEAPTKASGRILDPPDVRSSERERASSSALLRRYRRIWSGDENSLLQASA